VVHLVIGLGGGTDADTDGAATLLTSGGYI
jgi:hypothetical protein